MKKSIYLLVGFITIALYYPTTTSAQIISVDMIKEKAGELSADIISNAQEMLEETKENISPEKEEPTPLEIVLFTKYYETKNAPSSRLSLAKSNLNTMKEIYEQSITNGERIFPIENYEFSDSVAGAHPFDIRTKVFISPLDKNKQLLFITIKSRPNKSEKLIAKNVFSSIEFNPRFVNAYTLLGHIAVDVPIEERDYRYTGNQLLLNSQLKEKVLEGTETCYIFELTPEKGSQYDVAKDLRYQANETPSYPKEKGMVSLTYTPVNGLKSWTIHHPISLKVE